MLSSFSLDDDVDTHPCLELLTPSCRFMERRYNIIFFIDSTTDSAVMASDRAPSSLLDCPGRAWRVSTWSLGIPNILCLADTIDNKLHS